MISFASVLARLPSLDERRLRFWIAEDWVRPMWQGGELLFAEIDLARLHLILDLQELEVSEAAIPVVLSLLDQLHRSRRQMRRMLDALDEGAIDQIHRTIGHR